MSLMKKLVWKFHRPGHVMMNISAGACSTAEACALLDQHERFVGCDEYSKLLKAGETDPALTLFSQVLDQNSDFSGRAEVKAAAKVFHEQKAGL